jgi:hypothetical protein
MSPTRTDTILRRPHANGSNKKRKMNKKRRMMTEQKNSCTVNTTKSCRGVRFNDEVIIYSTRSNHQESSSSSTWLIQDDFRCIQNGVFKTLDAMNMMSESEKDNVSDYNPFFCSRGLEDYSTQDKGLLKHSVTTRRKHAVHAVLQEQEWQRVEGLTCYYDDISIRQAYENANTRINTNNAISMGKKDSEEALNIYAEQRRSVVSPSPSPSPLPSPLGMKPQQLQIEPPPFKSVMNLFQSPLPSPLRMNLFQNNNVHGKKWNFQQQQQHQQQENQDQQNYIQC